jgi:hypothetical protein
VRAKASARAQETFAVAQDAALADKTFEAVPMAHTAPADVSLTRSADGARSLAITRPILGTSGSETEGVAAASRQIVKLLRDGVAVPGGQPVHPDKLLWDAGSASPVQIDLVLGKVRQALAADNGDPSRLRVLVDGTVAGTEAELRKILSLPGEVRVVPVIRAPDGPTTWILSFDAQWLVNQGKGRRK